MPGPGLGVGMLHYIPQSVSNSSLTCPGSWNRSWISWGRLRQPRWWVSFRGKQFSRDGERTGYLVCIWLEQLACGTTADETMHHFLVWRAPRWTLGLLPSSDTLWVTDGKVVFAPEHGLSPSLGSDISQTAVSGGTSRWMVGSSFSPLSEKQMKVSACLMMCHPHRIQWVLLDNSKTSLQLSILDPNQQREPVQQTLRSVGAPLPRAFSFCKDCCNICTLHSWGCAPKRHVKWQLYIKPCRGGFSLQWISADVLCYEKALSQSEGKHQKYEGRWWLLSTPWKLTTQTKFHRAESQPMGGGGINGWKTLGVKSGFSVPQSPFLDGAQREGHTLPPGPQAQALRAMLWE